jgi:hypothetical protein
VGPEAGIRQEEEEDLTAKHIKKRNGSTKECGKYGILCLFVDFS